MESVFIAFWIILLVHVAYGKKTDLSIDDIMCEAEEKIKKSMPKFHFLTSPADNELSNYTVDVREEDFVKVQYDMLLKKEQYNKLIGNDWSLSSHRSRRNAVYNDDLWTHGVIPYTIDDAFNATETLSIKDAIFMWNEWTCLKISKSTNNNYNNVKFLKSNTTGCGESSVGMMQGTQYINISQTCATNVRAIAHEIGHTIGLYHEHMRHDRNDFVTVYEDNINSTKKKEFGLLIQDEYQGFRKPYDYRSIMHYGKLFYSKNKTANLVTISPKNEYYLDIIGKVKTISYYDAKIVCQLYDCAAKCSHVPCSMVFKREAFMGDNCKCMCEGSSDDNPIKICGEPCKLPTQDNFKYNIIKKNGHIQKESGPFNHGTTFGLEWKDTHACGYDKSTYRCDNGEWKIANLLECHPVCVMKTNLTTPYDMCTYYPTSTESGVADSIENCDVLDDYEYGDNITLHCKLDLTTMATSQCLNGSWTNFSLDCPKVSFGHESCPSETYYLSTSRYQDTCYLLVKSPATYEQARNGCKHYGGKLVKIYDKETMAFVSYALTMLNMTNLKMWLGCGLEWNGQTISGNGMTVQLYQRTIGYRMKVTRGNFFIGLGKFRNVS